MKGKKKNPINQTIVPLDLTEFSLLDDPEAISEDGIMEIACICTEMGRQGWLISNCHREEENLCVLYLVFRKREVKPDAT